MGDLERHGNAFAHVGHSLSGAVKRSHRCEQHRCMVTPSVCAHLGRMLKMPAQPGFKLAVRIATC